MKRPASFWFGPLLFTKSSCIPPSAGRSASRSGAGDASCAAAKGRARKNSASPSCAAKLSRRRLSLRQWVCHSNTAWKPPCRRAVSVAHSASAVLGASIHTSCDGFRFIAASASALGMCGGWMSATRRFPARPSIFCNKRNSPIPGWLMSSSIMLLTGQPPEGNCASRIGCPVETTRVFDRASCEARQIDG